MTAEGRRQFAFFGAVALGIAIRTVDFLNCRSLGLDEARLGVNVAFRSFAGLLRPLDLDQSAPPLFLWAERVTLLLFNYSPCALRLLPVLAGILAAALMYPLARRFLGEGEARVAALIGVFCPLLITYSNAAKQYSFEVLVALALLLVLMRPTPPRGSAQSGLTIAAGVVAPWASLTSLFVLAVAWAALMVNAVRGRRRADVGLWAVATGLWVTSALAAYLLVYRAASQNPYMRRFWELAFVRPDRAGFLPHLGKTLEDLVWGFVAGDPLIDRRPFLPYLHAGTVLVLLFIAAGVLRLVRTRAVSAAWYLGGPTLAVFAASGVGLFPVAPRLTLFMLPGLIVLFVCGTGELLAHAGATVARHQLTIVTALIVLPMEFQAVVRTFALAPSGQFQQIVSDLRQHRAPNEPVYIFARALPAWIFYTVDWAHPDTARVRYLIRAAGAGGFAFENAPSRRRVSVAELEAARPAAAAPGELLGLPSGMEWREVQEHLRAAPDSGWVEAERGRIEGAARPRVWVLATTYYAPETELFKVLEQDAVRRTFARIGPGSALVRYEFAAGRSDSVTSHKLPLSFGRKSTNTTAGR